MARFTYGISRTLYVDCGGNRGIQIFDTGGGGAREKCRLDDENKSVRVPVNGWNIIMTYYNTGDAAARWLGTTILLCN